MILLQSSPEYIDTPFGIFYKYVTDWGDIRYVRWDPVTKGYKRWDFESNSERP